MFLTAGEARGNAREIPAPYRAVRPVAVLVCAFTLSLFLSACAPLAGSGRDDGEGSCTGPGGTDGGRWRLRFDDAPGRGRKARAARLAGDPHAQPSFKELREARAAARMEMELYHSGGYARILPDGSSTNPDQVKFAATPGALNLEIAASECLNSVDGQPHALTLVVYQVSDRLMFDQLAASEAGIAKLLAGERFDEAVKSVRQFFIQPGLRNRLSMERAEDARYVVLVAGYHTPSVPADSLRVFPYGIGQYTVKGETPAHRDKLRFRPLPLNIRVELGDTGMAVFETTRIFNNMHNSVKLRSRTNYTQLPDSTVAVFGR